MRVGPSQRQVDNIHVIGRITVPVGIQGVLDGVVNCRFGAPGHRNADFEGHQTGFAGHTQQGMRHGRPVPQCPVNGVVVLREQGPIHIARCNQVPHKIVAIDHTFGGKVGTPHGIGRIGRG